jgi:hypothetical protein
LNDTRHRADEKLTRGESVKDPACEVEIPDPNPIPDSPVKRKADEAVTIMSNPPSINKKRFIIKNGEKAEIGMDGKLIKLDENMDMSESNNGMFDVNAFGSPVKTTNSSTTRFSSGAFESDYVMDDAKAEPVQSESTGGRSNGFGFDTFQVIAGDALANKGEAETAGNDGDEEMDDIYGA